MIEAGDKINENNVFIFVKNDYVGLNNSEVEEAFMQTLSQASTIQKHEELIEEMIGEDTFVAHIFFKYEHSGISFEVSPSCQWDSCPIGVALIRKSSDVKIEEAVSFLNDALEDDY